MNKKNVGLAVTLFLIAAAIWYIDGTKARPGAPAGGAPQAISVGSTAASTTSANAAASTAAALKALAAADKQAGYAPAIEIVQPTGFINASSSFRLADLIGKKVILLDFWTYSCINCIRTIPYLTAWYQRYRAQGLEIVGVHTPEFDFEKNYDNVEAAVERLGITYPVVLDSDYGTWTAYGNLYWPHEYLIDLAGYIVHDQIGEGNYDETEKEIQKLLAERSAILGTATMPMPTSTVFIASSTVAEGAISPETYFGSSRNQYLGNGTPGEAGIQSLDEPPVVAPNTLYLVGTWDFAPEYAQASASGQIDYRYDAKGVYFVAGSASGTPIDVEVLRDGQPVSQAVAGTDIFYKEGKSYVRVDENRLYRIIDDAAPGNHLLEFIITSPGLQAYTFTFG